MRTFAGTHGTSAEKKRKIVESGRFTPGSGRAGQGAYFWRKSPSSRELAIAWARQCIAERRFRNEKTPKWAVIHVEIGCGKREYLDLENPDLTDRLDELRRAKGLDLESDEQLHANLRTELVTALQTELKTFFKVLSVKVAPPSREFAKDYSISLLGAPICYVVRDVACIKVTNFEEEP
jgi:hypothetical protein